MVNGAIELEAVSSAAIVAPNAETDTQRREFRELIQTALAQIDDPYRTILIMREIQELKYEEICDAMEMPLNTVKVYLHRGRRKLRGLLSERIPRDAF